MKAYIDQHREVYGVEPICKVLQVAPSAYRRHAAGPCVIRHGAATAPGATSSSSPMSCGFGRRTTGPTAPTRSGGNRIREGVAVARCTVERLMRT